LMVRGERPGYGWRVDPSGLTFVTYDDTASGRRIEISDTEVPRSLYLRFQPNHPEPIGPKPTPDDPVFGVNMLEAAAFCNWLGGLTGLPSAYESLDKGVIPPAATMVHQAGFRVVTAHEFEIAARAETRTHRYFGDEPELVPFYAWTAGVPGGPRMHPVGRLKPNDLGLFDMLGNALEICQVDVPPKNERMQTVYHGGSALGNIASLDVGLSIGPTLIAVKGGLPPAGFHVIRTLRDSRVPPP
jgi:hypothetical protein